MRGTKTYLTIAKGLEDLVRIIAIFQRTRFKHNDQTGGEEDEDEDEDGGGERRGDQRKGI